MRQIGIMVITVPWLAGVVIAQGFWSTLFCVIPFWAWYLTVERVMQMWGIV